MVANQFLLNHSNNKRDGVCIYFKEFLAILIVDTQHMNGYIIFGVSLKNKNGYTVSLYKSRSQSRHVFREFLFNFDQFLSNVTIRRQQLMLFTGAVNARSAT